MVTVGPVGVESPDRLYTVIGGRRGADVALDPVSLVVAESGPSPDMQSEHVDILRLCARPVAVVELAARLGLPLSVVRILLGDLLDRGAVIARHPVPPINGEGTRNDPETLKQVLHALQRL
ncbi:DUF742 domain-containing protein [Nocardiopsis alba]|uniref:DUF742 domain-containing protein n=2 Tax=Nocardiopsis alba TaxID=53437 RepID=A0A7K2IN24_9ACTN|nr:DUF742 domain-containing protein [Nocardiopsis alba]AFR05834.1 hypothetical protein B005_0270 [Nocardiopsis alba ATCC BAA-2165]MYR31382.1 DUF742 domain-containing protein [Nocardiopsis alba]